MFCFLSVAKGLSTDKDISNHDKDEGWKLASMSPLLSREDTVKRVLVAHGASVSPGGDSVPFFSSTPGVDVKGRRHPEDVVLPGEVGKNLLLVFTNCCVESSGVLSLHACYPLSTSSRSPGVGS